MTLREGWLLLGHEARLALRDWLASGGRAGMRGGLLGLVRGRTPALVSYVLLGLLWAGFSWLGGQGLRAVGPVENTLALAALSAGLLLLATIMLAQAITTAVETIYVRADLDFLLSAPVSPAAVLGVRMAGLALRVGVLWLAVALGAALFALAAGDWRWVSLPLAVFGLALLVVGLALRLADVLLGLFGVKRARSVGQVVSALVGAAIVVGMQILRVTERGASAEEWNARLESVLRSAPPPTSLLWTPARAFTADGAALAIWLTLAIGIFGLAVQRFAKRYRLAAAQASATGRKHKRLKDHRAFVGGVRAAALRKEVRLLLRNPQLISALLLPFIYLLGPIGALLSSGMGSNGSPIIGAVAGSFITWIAVVAARGLTGLTLLTEEAADLVAAAPVAQRELQLSKLLAALCPVYGVVSAASLGIAWFSQQAALAGFVGAGVAATSAGLVAVRRGRPRDKKQVRAGMTSPRMPIGVTVAGGFATSAYVSAVGLAASPAWPAAIIPALIGLGITLAMLEGDGEG